MRMYLGLVAHAALDLQRRVAREVAPGHDGVDVCGGARAHDAGARHAVARARACAVGFELWRVSGLTVWGM